MKRTSLVTGILIAGFFFAPVRGVLNTTYVNSAYAQEKLSGDSEPAKLKAKLAEIEKRINESPSAKLYAAKANVLAFLDENEKAIQAISQAIKLSPNTGKYYGYRGLLYASCGNVEKTISDIEKGKELGSSDPDYLGILAMALTEKKDFQNALKNAETALRMNPNLYSALHARGRIRFNKKEYSKALNDFSLAIQQRMGSSEIYLERASVWDKLGNSVEAKKDRAYAKSLKSKSRK